ncbi:MAG: HEAT repeat domain-containing protein [Proteobacteria bacterium]|nr:HEAT repeat domain-containing protein [Pseudomonadota bacterium]
MSRKLDRLYVGFAIVTAVIFTSSGAFADARTTYLINMLEKGGNYRIRVQAATTLGKLRSKDAVPALVRALKDEHDLVVISVATALGQIGDPAVIPYIEKIHQRTGSRPVRSQLEATLRVLKALSPQDGSRRARASNGKPRFFIRVDAMGNSSGVQQAGILETMNDIVVQRLGREPGVVIQDSEISGQEVRSKLKRDGLKGYIISGSLIKMVHMGNRVTVKMGLNVFTNPEYNLLMMPTAEAAVPMGSGSVTQLDKQAAQERAMRAVTDRLVSSIFENLRQ